MMLSGMVRNDKTIIKNLITFVIPLSMSASRPWLIMDSGFLQPWITGL